MFDVGLILRAQVSKLLTNIHYVLNVYTIYSDLFKVNNRRNALHVVYNRFNKQELLL